MRWNYLFHFYFKRMRKSKLYMGVSILFFILLFSRLIFFLTPQYYGDWPSEVAMIVQMVSLFYIVYFYRTFSSELLYGIQSFFVDGHRIMLEKISAMFAAHFIYQGIMVVFTYGMFTVLYFIVGIEPSSIYLSLFRFLLIYMLAPLMLNVLYGVIIAIFFGTRKISFFAILLLWIATGSMITELFTDYFSTVHADDWQSLFFIGTNYAMTVYQSYTGFDIHWGNELKLVTWFLVFSGIVLVLSLRWSLRKPERNLVIKVVVAMSLLSVVSAYGVGKVSTKAFNNADLQTEFDYYMDIKKTETDMRYEIESYSISLKKKQATVEISFSDMNTLEPTFQLYHAYPVHVIQAGNEPVKFERSGDIIKVYLPKSTSSLTFYYELVDTHFVPYTNGRTVLQADMAWYPKKRATPMYEINEDTGWTKLSERFLSNESYPFTVQAEDVLFCNLPKQGDIYSGESQAVSLIKGQGKQLTFGDYSITYPADWPKMKEKVGTVLSQLETTVQEVQLLAPTTIQALPTTIVFSRFSPDPLMTKDHLVYNTSYREAVDDYEVTKDFQQELLKLFVQRKGPYRLHLEWINLASQLIREKNEWIVDFKMRSIDFFDYPKAEQEQIELVYHLYYQLDAEQQQQFLQTWYKEMDETWGWDQVLDLIEEWS
ncbi:ABC transporter permease [Sporosarcina sp. PTS2304]|uniref:O-antigen polymerase n=1 Tax=Sporosarcina sp. PTS2304 TaxID=2283194 RepID=UPI000E0D0D0D|nr:O-antigen polymerase [Sporosarcina sp. PTS2304]AXI01092.1 ABC transporter permease [Sporosarcina sp. PTS2304]